MSRSSRSDKKPLVQYDHKGKELCYIPSVGLVTPEADPDSGKKTYSYAPHLDPSLQWAGKAEHPSYKIPTVSYHIHERWSHPAKNLKAEIDEELIEAYRGIESLKIAEAK